MSSYMLEPEVRSPELYLYLAVLGRFVTMFPQEALAKRHEGNGICYKLFRAFTPLLFDRPSFFSLPLYLWTRSTALNCLIIE